MLWAQLGRRREKASRSLEFSVIRYNYKILEIYAATRHPSGSGTLPSLHRFDPASDLFSRCLCQLRSLRPPSFPRLSNVIDRTALP